MSPSLNDMAPVAHCQRDIVNVKILRDRSTPVLYFTAGCKQSCGYSKTADELNCKQQGHCLLVYEYIISDSCKIATTFMVGQIATMVYYETFAVEMQDSLDLISDLIKLNGMALL